MRRSPQDGYGLFGFFVMMLLFKGVLISAAGPAPNYDMQRVLSCKNPREASMMSGWVNVVLTFPRYFLITGLTVLALVFFSDQISGMGTNMDFERMFPYALGRFVPAGLLGILIAGLAGGLYVELCRHRQRRAALLRQRHLQALHQSHMPAPRPMCG